MDKVWAIFQVLQKGQEVADPAKWKARQIRDTVLAALLMAMVKAAAAFGYELPVGEGDAMVLGSAFIVIYNIVLTLASSKKVGVGGTVSVVDQTDR